MEIDPNIIPYAVPPFIAAIFAFSLGFFIYSKNPTSKVHIYFSLFLLVCTVWLAGFAAMNVMRDASDAFVFSRILYTGVIFIPVFYYGFVIHMLGLKNRQGLLGLSFLIGFVFFYFLWASRQFLSGNIHYTWGFSSRAAWMHGLYLIFFFTIFFSSFVEMYKSYKFYKHKDALTANRIKYVLLGFMIALCGSTDFLSTYGVSYYPLGFLFMALFSLITSYAIIKYNLLDIKVAIRKGVLYSVSFVLISTIMILFIILSERISQIYFGYSSLFFTFLAVLAISILFIPLHNYFMKTLNQIIFGASPDELAEQNVKFREELQRQDRLKAVATLAAGMAHEIKNPLTSIKTFAEYLPLKYDDPEFREKFKRIVAEEVGRVNGIVTQLLDFSKPKELDRQPVSVGEVLGETLNFLNNDFVAKKIEIKQEYTASGLLQADRNQLKQAFLNIFLNSIQAMPNGGTITVRTFKSDMNWVIEIRDTGCGIPTDNLSHLFDPFFTTKGSGTGLGLSIVHGIITKHGGTIHVESELDKGAVFRIFLPA